MRLLTLLQLLPEGFPWRKGRKIEREAEQSKQAKVRLRDIEVEYRAVVERLPAVVYIDTSDEVSSAIYMSPQCEEMLGYSPDEWISDPDLWARLLHPEDRDRTLIERNRSRATEEPFNSEYRLLARGGRVVWVHDHAILIRDHEGRKFWQGVITDITEHKEAEQSLRETEARFRTSIDHIPVITYTQDQKSDHRFVSPYLSAQVREVLGYSPAQFASDPGTWTSLIHPKDRERVLDEARRADETGEPFRLEYRVFAKDGRVVWVRDESILVKNQLGDTSYWQGVITDITEHKHAEEVVRESELRLRTVVANVAMMLFALDHAGVFTLSEGKGLDALGLEPGEAVGRSVSEVLGNRPEVLNDVDRALAGEEFSAVREINSRTFEVWYSPLKASTGEVSGVIGAAVDITERKQLEERLARLAYYDSLTDLPNRALFVHRLEEALDQTRNSRAYVAVVTLDLDDFRIINTSLGHEAGDRLLVAVAERLRRTLDAGDTVARLGGDTFSVLIQNMSGTEEAIEVVERIEEHIQTPISLRNQEISVTASIGVALGIGSRSEPKGLLGEADTAMSWAKYKGKAQSEVFDPSVMDARASERLALERDLRTAITTNELVLRYQPDILLDTQRVVGMMALLHWEHPDRGLLRPSEFIPVAEGSRLVLPIGQRILREACRQAAEWQERHQYDPPFLMCVDLSARQFRQRGIAEEVATLLSETGLEPRSLNLRISESVAMKDARHTISTLEKLKSYGVQLSINNFGTGYSSLRYLNRFPVDFLVIDSSFVRNLWEGSADATVVSGMISLAHALGISAAAEGVETRKQVTLLRGMGCNLVRGGYFSPPLTSEAASEFLASSNHRDRPVAD